MNAYNFQQMQKQRTHRNKFNRRHIKPSAPQTCIWMHAKNGEENQKQKTNGTTSKKNLQVNTTN